MNLGGGRSCSPARPAASARPRRARWPRAARRWSLSGRRARRAGGARGRVGGRAVPADLARPDAPHAGPGGGRATWTCSSRTPALPASGELTSFSIEEIDRALAVNLRAPLVLARCSPSRWPRAAKATSCSCPRSRATRPRRRLSLYTATKFALRGFSLGLRQDLEATGRRRLVRARPGSSAAPGMFADSGAPLPPGVGTSTPEDVARGDRPGDRARPRGGRRRPARAAGRRAARERGARHRLGRAEAARRRGDRAVDRRRAAREAARRAGRAADRRYP